MSDERLIVGTMSGTSADGVDAAIVRISGRGLEMRASLVLHHHEAYPEDLRRQIFAFRGGEVREDVLGRLARVGRRISLATAEAMNEALRLAAVSASRIAAVACHGQTLFHKPPDTIQWLDPALVAARTGCLVVSDFRRADLAAGGQGAPLVPFADYILFRDAAKSRVLLNIGGIANITYLRAGGTPGEVIAFDTGPGNCISDAIMRGNGPSGCGFDAGGERAMRGQALGPELARVMSDEYFRKAPPKSTDGPDMLRVWEQAVDRDTGVEDQLATACAWTARAVLEAVAGYRADELIVSGGGARNGAMMRFLREGFGGVVMTSSDAGLEIDAKEAVAFALLAAATLDGVPSNVPSVTGAWRAVVLGSITPRP